MRTVLASTFVLRALRSARAHSSRLTLALGVHQAKVFKGEAADGEEAKTFIRDAQVLMCLCACACSGAHQLVHATTVEWLPGGNSATCMPWLI